MTQGLLRELVRRRVAQIVEVSKDRLPLGPVRQRLGPAKNESFQTSRCLLSLVLIDNC